jgi:hypothetical protein
VIGWVWIDGEGRENGASDRKESAKHYNNIVLCGVVGVTIPITFAALTLPPTVSPSVALRRVDAPTFTGCRPWLADQLPERGGRLGWVGEGEGLWSARAGEEGEGEGEGERVSLPREQPLSPSL